MSFSPGQSAVEGFRLVGRRPLSFVVWSLLTALMLAGALGVIWWAVGDGVRWNIIEAPEPEELLGLIGPLLLYGLAACLVCWLIYAVQICAIYRAVLRPGQPGLAYYRLGRAEFGMILLQLLLMLIFFGLEAVAFGGIFGVANSELQPEAKVLVCGLIGLAAVLLALFLLVRLSLAGPLLVAEGRLDLGRAWGLTRGRFWSLFGMGLLSFAVAIGVSSLGLAFLRPLLILAIGWLVPVQHLDWGRFGMVDPAMISHSAALMGAFAVLAVLVLTLQTAVQHAPWAAALRALNPPADSHR